MTRSFDQLSRRFAKHIYETPKGRLRLALLQEDLAALAAGPPLQVLDAGGGLGQMSRWLAAQGHSVVLCDASQAMLAEARAALQGGSQGARIELVHAPLEAYCARETRRFDLILCHAVLEWVAEPRMLLGSLSRRLKPGGWLSLMFYNRHALVLKNLLRGNFRQVKRDDWRGDGGGLTPDNPLDPEAVDAWLAALGVRIELAAGVRCLYDYLPAKVRQSYAFEDILEMERLHRQRLPYRQMARYIHLLGQVPTGAATA